MVQINVLLSDLWGEKGQNGICKSFQHGRISLCPEFKILGKRKRGYLKKGLAQQVFTMKEKIVSFRFMFWFVFVLVVILFEMDPGERARGYQKAEFGSIQETDFI